MGFFSKLFFGIMNQNNNYPQRGPSGREPTAEDYIRSGEIEEDNYDSGQRNSINEHGNLDDEHEINEK